MTPAPLPITVHDAYYDPRNHTIGAPFDLWADLPTDLSDGDYVTALHEIGHAETLLKLYPDWCSNLYDHSDRIHAELAAWEWALDHTEEFTLGMLCTMIAALNSYFDYFDFGGFWFRASTKDYPLYQKVVDTAFERASIAVAKSFTVLNH